MSSARRESAFRDRALRRPRPSRPTRSAPGSESARSLRTTRPHRRYPYPSRATDSPSIIIPRNVVLSWLAISWSRSSVSNEHEKRGRERQSGSSIRMPSTRVDLADQIRTNPIMPCAYARRRLRKAQGAARDPRAAIPQTMGAPPPSFVRGQMTAQDNHDIDIVHSATDLLLPIACQMRTRRHPLRNPRRSPPSTLASAARSIGPDQSHRRRSLPPRTAARPRQLQRAPPET